MIQESSSSQVDEGAVVRGQRGEGRSRVSDSHMMLLFAARRCVFVAGYMFMIPVGGMKETKKGEGLGGRAPDHPPLRPGVGAWELPY